MGDRAFGKEERAIGDVRWLVTREKSTRLGIDVQRIETSTEAAELAESLARVTTKRTRLLDLYLEGCVERVTFDARELPLVAEEAHLQRKIRLHAKGVRADHRIRNPIEWPAGAAPAAKSRRFRWLMRRSSGSRG